MAQLALEARLFPNWGSVQLTWKRSATVMGGLETRPTIQARAVESQMNCVLPSTKV